MSGRSPPLYCTLTLIALQGHSKMSGRNLPLYMGINYIDPHVWTPVFCICVFVWGQCMAINNVVVQYKNRCHLVVTQAPIFVWFDGTIIDIGIILLTMYYSVFCYVWCPCMVINISVQYNGGLLPDIILLTQGCYHRGTRLNAMKRFCICSL